MMRMLDRLRHRWGGAIRPSIDIRHDDGVISRWDGKVENAPGYVVTFEGFGLSATLFIGRTPSIEDQ